MTLEENQQEIIEEFSMFDDWMDKYNYLIELSKDLPEMSPDKKVPENLIDGCQSKVWLDAELKGDKLYFQADSDAIITKGIIALLIRVLSGKTPKEIKDADLYFIDKIGLKENLSPTRSNGLLAMVNKIKAYALAYNAKLNK
ncbi:MAG: SufE family protein [Bacteroidales bacterium]